MADALQASQPGTRRVLACGGGVHNPHLMDALRALLPGMTVASTATHGVDPDHMEAMGFAWLARRTLLGLPGNPVSVLVSFTTIVAPALARLDGHDGVALAPATTSDGVDQSWDLLVGTSTYDEEFAVELGVEFAERVVEKGESSLA